MDKNLENEKWVSKHKKDIEEAFNQTIADDRLVAFVCYDNLEEMSKEFYDFADPTKPYVKKVLNKWVIQIA